MTLTFPNRSRSFDATRRAVRFWGHDSAMESSFFVSEDALKRLQPNLPLGEVDLLETFDLNRDLILRGKRRLLQSAYSLAGNSRILFTDSVASYTVT